MIVSTSKKRSRKSKATRWEILRAFTPRYYLAGVKALPDRREIRRQEEGEVGTAVVVGRERNLTREG